MMRLPSPLTQPHPMMSQLDCNLQLPDSSSISLVDFLALAMPCCAMVSTRKVPVS